jgi:glutamyl-tRNA reductase
VPTTLPFHLVGISHHTADVNLRGKLALTPDETLDWLEQERAAGRAVVLLSTCNRFELYWWGDDDQDRRLRSMATQRGVSLHPSVLYHRDGAPAVRHLFAVAAGLDSQVLGESEVLGQVHCAHELSQRAGTTRWELDTVFCAALAAGRRVRHETTLGRHPASVSSAALAHAKLCWGGSLEGRSVLVLGAGEAAEGMLRALEGEPVGHVTVLNRTAERGHELAAAWEADAGQWDALAATLPQADILCATTAAPEPIVSAAMLETAVAVRGGRPLVVLDLAVPRNVEPAARDVPGVRLFDLDDLRLQHCPVTSGIAPALDDAERVLREEYVRFQTALRTRAAAPHLAELHRLGAELAQEEADRALAELGSLSERDREVVRQLASRLTRRLLYPASRAIRDREF